MTASATSRGSCDNVTDQRRDPESLLNWKGQVKLKMKIGCERDDVLVDVFSERHSRVHADGMHRVTLEGHGWRWYRVGAADNVLDRSDLQRAPQEGPTARDPGR